MIRLFAPPTSDTVLGRNALTAGNLLLHLIVVVLLAIPVGRAVQQGLFDNLVVYLVPPDRPAGLLDSKGTAPVPASATLVGQAPAGAPAVAEVREHQAVQAKGDTPEPSVADLDTPPRPLPSDNALTELQVDSAVVRDPLSAAPEYPSTLLAKGIEGFALALYVVDTLGAVDTLTIRFTNATHPDFVVAVRQALPRMRFRPAVQGGLRVRQLVQQTFRFRITAHDNLPIIPPRPTPPTA